MKVLKALMLEGTRQGLSAAEEARPETAGLQGFEFGFEADAIFDEGGFLLDEFEALLYEALAFGFELSFIFFEGGDGLFLEFALEFDQVEAFDLGPKPIYLHAGGVAFDADIFHLAITFFEAGLVVLPLLKEPFVTLERDSGKARTRLVLVPDHLSLEDLLLGVLDF